VKTHSRGGSSAAADGDSVDKLSSKGPASQVSPSRLRGAGAYTSHASGSSGTSARKKKDMPPLPETRRLADSFVEMDLLFSKDEGLRETYVGGLSMVRMGRLMEGKSCLPFLYALVLICASTDFDSLAGAAGYRYVLPDGTLPADASHYGLYLVTAAVDRIDLLRPLEDPSGSVPDLRLSGHVSYATTSSLEVFVRLSTIPKEGEKAETILVGRFAMACRKEGGGKHKIPVLEVVGLEEEEMMRMGKEMRIGKAERNLIVSRGIYAVDGMGLTREQSLEKQPPSAEEAAMMHSLFVGRANIFGELSRDGGRI
jgi:acyl-coenzyme A thioesterase 9